MEFYKRVLESLKSEERLSTSDSILIIAGGNKDRQVMIQTGMREVVISNLNYHAGHTDYEPYSWKKIDAEAIEADDESYDWVIIYAALHHLSVPAKGVCEMFRVARKGIVCFEARDSLLMKLLVKTGLSSEYELLPAFSSNGLSGGYRGGPIPNYVYRWSEREFIKVINSYAPSHDHNFIFHYGYKVPVSTFMKSKSSFRRKLGFLLVKLEKLATLILPKQGNQFAFCALKNSSIKPWLKEDFTVDMAYLSRLFDGNSNGL
jgi:hypothetical protein